MIRCLIRTLVIGQIFGFSVSFGQQKPVYFDDYRALADSLSLVYQIPSCVMLAVAYHESGGGVSIVAKKLNNHFGIVGDCRYDITKHKSKYRYYSTITDSYIGFCKLVASKKFYESMLGNTDEKLWLKKLGATGYASDPNWSTTVYKIVVNKCH
ncbi:MAG: glucosaminidase domain-containing protein [Flavobacteriales bacterium]